jgi:hypothetical protein
MPVGAWLDSLSDREQASEDEDELIDQADEPTICDRTEVNPDAPGLWRTLGTNTVLQRGEEERRGYGPSSVQNATDPDHPEDAELDSDIMDLLTSHSFAGDTSVLDSYATDDMEELKRLLDLIVPNRSSVGANHSQQ